jgi:transposase
VANRLPVHQAKIQHKHHKRCQQSSSDKAVDTREVISQAWHSHLTTQAQRPSWIAEGHQVFCVQESCGFGFTLHRRLVEAGAQSFLITPVALNGARKTDKLDARALCLRLSRWLDGNRDELAPIRIPTEAEQRRRETTRRRQFLSREIRALANRGHGQVAEYCHEKLPARWWGPRLWKKLEALDPWVLGLLTDLRALILAIEQQLRALEAEIKTRVKDQPRPKALGELTLGTLDGEICDWARFHNRKQIGSYTGCCPGEHSSGGKRRVGAIDRIGNGRVRALLVEAVWRFLRWQPDWKSAQRMKLKLAGPNDPSSATRRTGRNDCQPRRSCRVRCHDGLNPRP